MRAEVRRFLAERVDVRAQIELPGAHDPDLWKQMTALGWLDEMPFVDECILIEEAGRALLPGPFLAHRLGMHGLELPEADTDLTRPRGAERASISPVSDAAAATVAICAESCGVASRALEMAVEYAKARSQFGRPIGSFQAIKHKAADMHRAVEAARLATYAAAWAVDNESEHCAVAAATAKALSNEAVLRATKENIQIHGGVGVTWEHDAHLFYRRALANSIAFGDTESTVDRIANAMLAGS